MYPVFSYSSNLLLTEINWRRHFKGGFGKNRIYFNQGNELFTERTRDRTWKYQAFRCRSIIVEYFVIIRIGIDFGHPSN